MAPDPHRSSVQQPASKPSEPKINIELKNFFMITSLCYSCTISICTETKIFNKDVLCSVCLKSFAIVVYFNVFEHMTFCNSSSDQFFSMNGLNFETMIPAFHGCIVKAIAALTHAADQPMNREQLLIIMRAVLRDGNCFNRRRKVAPR